MEKDLKVNVFMKLILNHKGLLLHIVLARVVKLKPSVRGP